MKTSTIVLAAIAQVASAHYFFDTNIIGGVAQPQFKYVRSSTRATKYNPIKFSSNPPADIRDGSTADGPDIVCNQGAFSSAGRTEVLTVNAGDEVRLRLGVSATMQHPGPGLVYMSKAPGSVKEYDGINGDWFKIFQEGVCSSDADFTSKAWCTWDRNYITAKIPLDTPEGEYLMRYEHIGVHRCHVNQPEHYVSCIQVKVQNGGNGTPGPLVKFPGAYKATDPYANFNIYTGKKDFPFPGPAVWAGGAGGQATSPAVNSTSAAASKPTPTPTTLRSVAAPKPTSISAGVLDASTTSALVAPSATSKSVSTVSKPKPTRHAGCGGKSRRRHA